MGRESTTPRQAHPRVGTAESDRRDVDHGDVNHVVLSGRVGAPAERRDLPSGDTLVTFRVIVRRAAGERGSVDTLECATTNKRVARAVLRWGGGEHVTVEGRLRRRFWQGAGGLQSRYAVDVIAARRVSS